MLRHYLAGFGLGAVMLISAWMTLFIGQFGRPTASSRWVVEAMSIKAQRAESLKGQPKLVVLAGSSALFGVDSSMLERAWGRPVLNAGINAGLLLDYTLHATESWVGRGDVVLMPMEYSMLNYDGEINSQLIDRVLARDPAYWWGLPMVDKLRFAALVEPQRLVRGWQALADAPVGAGLYGGHNIDSRGDQVNTEQERRTPQSAAELGAALPWTYGKRSPPSATGWKLLGRYAERMRSKGVCVIVMPPTLMFAPSYRDDPIEHAYFSGMAATAKSHGLTYVGDPYAFMYARDNYYNSDYHLHARAREMHTRNMISVLGPELSRWCEGQLNAGDRANSPAVRP